jgi:hypothetical protein
VRHIVIGRGEIERRGLDKYEERNGERVEEKEGGGYSESDIESNEREKEVVDGWFFDTWFFADGFLFPVKELWLVTNLDQWVRVLDVIGSYMYIVL